MITLNYSELNEGIKAGTYEAVFTEWHTDATPYGTEYTQLTLEVRNDIEQASKNYKIRHTLWTSKETGTYVDWVVNRIAKEAGLQEGMQFNSYEDIFNAFIGRPVKIDVFIKEEEGKDGTIYKKPTISKFHETAYPNVQHVSKQPQQQQPVPTQAQNQPQPQPQVQQTDLPF